MKFKFFECEYCSKRYVSEKVFAKHKCKEKTRWLGIDSKQTRSAYFCYIKWLGYRGFSNNNTKIGFLESKYFDAFGRFVKYASDMMLPDRLGYIKFMVEKQFLPVSWCMDEVYLLYMENFEKLYTPMQQVEISIETISTCARILDCNLHEIWEYLHFAEVLKMIESKKLSPWFLLYCDTFMEYIKKCSRDEKIRFDAVIEKDKWLALFRENPEIVTSIIYINASLKV